MNIIEALNQVCNGKIATRISKEDGEEFPIRMLLDNGGILDIENQGEEGIWWPGEHLSKEDIEADDWQIKERGEMR